jgi:hypothetical protein
MVPTFDCHHPGTIQPAVARHWTTGPLGVGSEKQTSRTTDLMLIGIALLISA